MNQINKQRIGLVLPSIPAYSETFFNAKIKGLQENGFEVILFSKSKIEDRHPTCKTVFAPNFSISPKLVFTVALIIYKCLLHSKKSIKLFKLNQKQGLSATDSIKNIFINSYFFSHQLTWLHFGFGTMALQSEHVAEVIQAKMAVSFRGFDFYVYPIKYPTCYQLLFSKKVYYHVLSDSMKKDLMGIGIESAFIEKITPAIDINYFRGTKISNPQPIKQFVTIGRLHWIKGYEHILEAFALLKKRGVHFHFTIIGDGSEKEKLLFAVHQLGLNDHITFAGKIKHEHVKNYLEKSDYYIQYSIQEGFGNAVLEAQAMGLLCIVSDADGLVENVLDNQTGFVVPKRNSNLLALKIEEVLVLNEIEKSTIINQALKRIKFLFSLDKQKEKFINFYEQTSR